MASTRAVTCTSAVDILFTMYLSVFVVVWLTLLLGYQV